MDNLYQLFIIDLRVASVQHWQLSYLYIVIWTVNDTVIDRLQMTFGHFY